MGASHRLACHDQTLTTAAEEAHGHPKSNEIDHEVFLLFPRDE